MPEIKKFKKLYKPLTPEQRQQSVDAAITKRIAQFEKMDQKHFRKLTKAAREAKEFEMKKLRRRLQVLKESNTQEEAEEEQTYDLAKVAEMERADLDELEAEIKCAQKINPETIATMAFQRLHADLEKIQKKEAKRLVKEAAEKAALKAEVKAEDEAGDAPEAGKRKHVEVEEEGEDEPEQPPAKKKKPPTKEKLAEKQAKDIVLAKKAKKLEAKLNNEEQPPVKGNQQQQQMGVSTWAQNKMQSNQILQSWEEKSPFRSFAVKVMKHGHFNDAYLYVKKVQLQTKAKLEKFKVLCAKHQLLAEQKALEETLNPPEPKPKKGKKGQQQKKKKFYPKLTDEEKKAAKKFKYSKNKERNKQRKLEAEQRKAAAPVPAQ